MNAKPIFKSAVLAGSTFLAGANAFALTDGPYTTSFPGSGTTAVDFSGSLSLPKFNVPGGILQSITFTLSGGLSADQKFENLGNAGATITVTSTGTMTLKRPDLTTLVVTVPQVVNTRTVTAQDGNVDFGGNAGFTFPTTAGSLSNTQSYSTPSDIALFSGAGNISLPVTAVGNSSGSGAASLAVVATLTGSATATVTYTYTVAAVPEPSTYGAIGAVSVVGFLGYRRARRKMATPTVS